MKKILLASLCLIMTLPAFTQTFQYTYEGKTLNYRSLSPWECAVSENQSISGAVSIPKKVTYRNRDYSVIQIAHDAFIDCLDLTSITLPESVTSIEDFAFNSCKNLKSISIDKSVSSFGNNTVPASNLNTVSLPYFRKSIGDMAFNNCESLTSVSLPSSIESIGRSAFSNCQNLVSINLPDSIISIEDFAFESCHNLKSVTIPNSITSIGRFAFATCNELASITLGKKLKNISVSTFIGCDNLKSITSLAAVPPHVDDTGIFFIPNNCIVYVDKQSVEAYQKVYWWKDYESIQEIKKIQTSANSGVLTVSGSNGSIVVENAPVGSTVVVKDTNNVTVATEEVKESNQTINLGRKGIFIVNVDNATYKVAL